MREKRSSEPRVWASRDRSISPPNRIRARAMRLNPTDAERKLWWHLRHRLTLPESHFRRQVRLGHYIVDFACHRLRIAIEIDAASTRSKANVTRNEATFLNRKAIASYVFGTMKC